MDNKIIDYIASTYHHDAEENDNEPPKCIQLPTHSTSIMSYTQALTKLTLKRNTPFQNPPQLSRGNIQQTYGDSKNQQSKCSKTPSTKICI